MQYEKNFLIRLGQAVKSARQRAGLTQVEAAEKIGVSREYLGRIEIKGKNMTIQTLENLASAVDTDIFELLLEAAPKDEARGSFLNEVSRILSSGSPAAVKKATKALKGISAPK